MDLYRFYRIVSTAGEECYIGSTTQTLCNRFSNHKSAHKLGRGTASSILFTKYGVETCSIVLISEQEMEKIDARREERRLIEECLTAINKIRPVREIHEFIEETKEYKRKYQEEHRDELKKLSHKYYTQHRERMLEDYRKYRIEHRDEAKEYNRKYRKEHHDTLKAYYAEQIPCDTCGKIVSRYNMARHKRTKSCVPPQQ